MATVAKLVESGDLDLDKPVQYYVPEFPDKFWDGQKVNHYWDYCLIKDVVIHVL